MRCVVLMHRRERSGDEEGQGEGGSRGRQGGEEKGERARGDVRPNAVFSPEIAITQMRCWLEGRCVSASPCVRMCISISACVFVSVRVCVHHTSCYFRPCP